MADDFFALLGGPRRPWLDPEQVKETFHHLSRTLHPDQQAEATGDFARLNEAQATLRDPKSRLRHLLELEHPQVRLAGPAGIPPGLANLFAPVHGLLQDVDSLLGKKISACSALAKALLARDEFTLREKVENSLAELETLEADALAELQAFDTEWTSGLPGGADRLHMFYQRFAYLSRWIAQLRERLFQLGM